MASARYWRVVGVECYVPDADLELSALHLYGLAGRVDADATLSASHTPAAGSLSNLQDADAATLCRFSASDMRAAGFFVQWDCGTPTEVIGVRLGAGSAPPGFVAALSLMYFDGTTWLVAVPVGRSPWPGAGALTAVPEPGDPDFSSVKLSIHADGLPGGAIVDSSASGRLITPVGSAQISTTQSVFGGSSVRIDSGGYLSVVGGADFSFGTGNFCVEMRLRFDNVGGTQTVATNRSVSGADTGFYIRLTGGKMQALSWGPTPGTQMATITGATSILANVWYHVAYERQGSTFRLLLQGAVDGSVVDTAAIADSTNPVLFGIDPSTSGRAFSGYMDEIRIGTVDRYKGAYVVPARPFPDSASSGNAFLPPLTRTRFDRGNLACQATVGPHQTKWIRSLSLARDVEFGGQGTVYGTTKTKGTPANTATKARVVLLHQRSKQPVRETWSDPVTGAFAFTGIDTTQQFLTLAEDAAGNFRPVAANRLAPEVLP